MQKEKGNSSERRKMHNDDGDGVGGCGGGGVAAQVEVNAGPTKRVRRPSVRLNHPYYENAGAGGVGVRLQQRWDAFKKDLEGARKSKTLKTPISKNGKSSNAEGTTDSNLDTNDDDDDDDDDDYDEDDDMAIGNWKNLNSVKRDRDFNLKSKTKRAKPLSFIKNKDQENEKFEVSNSSESENQENLGANGVHTNLDVSFGNEKLTDGDDDCDDNVVEKQGKLKRGVMSSDQDLDDKEKDGVRVWLNELGLGKYAPTFEFHEVDDAVLPFLTIEDLKDMGISAVGSRRKMYRSIQKLGKGFS